MSRASASWEIILGLFTEEIILLRMLSSGSLLSFCFVLFLLQDQLIRHALDLRITKRKKNRGKSS
jgi:hypothetical protein